MSRLVDADELENMTFSKMYTHNGIMYVPLLEVRQNISNAKTAYDVEKVVAELEELPKGSTWNHNSDNINRSDAIEVVRKGGVNE